MRRYKALLIAGLFLFIGITGLFSADLKTLMEVGASQADMAKAMRQETENYNSIKSAVAAGEVKPGMKAESIRKKFGEPVINIYDKKRGAAKWLYMPASSTHFKGEKIYLYFDREDKVLDWEKVEQ